MIATIVLVIVACWMPLVHSGIIVIKGNHDVVTTCGSEQVKLPGHWAEGVVANDAKISKWHSLESNDEWKEGDEFFAKNHVGDKFRDSLKRRLRKKFGFDDSKSDESLAQQAQASVINLAKSDGQTQSIGSGASQAQNLGSSFLQRTTTTTTTTDGGQIQNITSLPPIIPGGGQIHKITSISPIPPISPITPIITGGGQIQKITRITISRTPIPTDKIGPVPVPVREPISFLEVHPNPDKKEVEEPTKISVQSQVQGIKTGAKVEAKGLDSAAGNIVNQVQKIVSKALPLPLKTKIKVDATSDILDAKAKLNVDGNSEKKEKEKDSGINIKTGVKANIDIPKTIVVTVKPIISNKGPKNGKGVGDGVTTVSTDATGDSVAIATATVDADDTTPSPNSPSIATKKAKDDKNDDDDDD